MSTPYHSMYWASLLSLKGSASRIEALTRPISNARVDLNPHQVDAALFAFRSPFSKGVLLADEVGLGKTIEAGIVIAQRWAERRRRILLILPASLRKQWMQELEEKFFLPSLLMESRNFNQMRKEGKENPLDQEDRIVICSYPFAAAKADEIRRLPWALVVIDEAHRLRNVYKKDNKIARALAGALASTPKLLLTATPLQNNLMELYGLVSFIDPHIFGDGDSFREQFTRTDASATKFAFLRQRIKPVCTRYTQEAGPGVHPLHRAHSDYAGLHPKRCGAGPVSEGLRVSPTAHARCAAHGTAETHDAGSAEAARVIVFCHLRHVGAHRRTPGGASAGNPGPFR